METAVNAGFKFIQFRVPEPGEAEAVSAYLRTLEPAVSPHRKPDGSLTEKAKRGQAIFESEAAACTRCHPAPLYTDLKIHDVGTRRPLDKASEFDTPTLLELWRTGPYLHNGEAVTLEEVLVKFNAKDEHGKTSHLSKEEIGALVAYLLSL